jgi:hypothetical protein
MRSDSLKNPKIIATIEAKSTFQKYFYLINHQLERHKNHSGRK